MPLIAIKDCTDEMLATVKSANDESRTVDISQYETVARKITSNY